MALQQSSCPENSHLAAAVVVAVVVAAAVEIAGYSQNRLWSFVGQLDFEILEAQNP